MHSHLVGGDEMWQEGVAADAHQPPFVEDVLRLPLCDDETLEHALERVPAIRSEQERAESGQKAIRSGQKRSEAVRGNQGCGETAGVQTAAGGARASC